MFKIFTGWFPTYLVFECLKTIKDSMTKFMSFKQSILNTEGIKILVAFLCEI